MSEEAPHHFNTIDEWRKWLEKHHQTEDSIWLIIQKKASKKQGIRYEETVLEAVAYGWIDGKVKRLNEAEFMQRFTPRRSGSIWSLSNKKRVERLIKEGRMTPAGMQKVNKAKENGQWDKAYTSRAPVQTPEDLEEALKSNSVAEKHFNAFPNSAKFMYIHWINEAKRIETRKRRIYTVVVRSEQDKRPGIDLRVINP